MESRFDRGGPGGLVVRLRVRGGVETAAQLELLKTWGGRIVQGYYFARPLPVPEVTAILRAGEITPARVNPVAIVAK